MCGIIAYLGARPALNILLDGLRRMEYRGYDSAGVGVISEGKLHVVKKKGKVENLVGACHDPKLSTSTMGVAHTRWATHGPPNDKNSHPHCNMAGTIAVVHNGIIENFNALRTVLKERGYVFVSDTDTEVLAHLIDSVIADVPSIELVNAVALALQQVEGTFGCIVMSTEHPDILIGARKGSPLILGITDTELILASDASAIVEHTRKVIYLDDYNIIRLQRNGKYEIANIHDFNEMSSPKRMDHAGRKVSFEEIAMDLESINKGGYEHFMLKEICEQGKVIEDCMRGRVNADGTDLRLGGLMDVMPRLASARRLIFAACGTSWHAALVGEYLIEEIARISVEVEYASEFRYRDPMLFSDDVLIVISQSGETADTLAAIKLAKEKGVLTIGIVNTVGSTIARETDAGVYLHIGPEIGVASTKAFTGQVTVLNMLALVLAKARGVITPEKVAERCAELKRMPALIEQTLKQKDLVEKEMKAYRFSNNFIFLGRGLNFPVALEGALKLKEISYIHAEGYPAAEMKHGPIALIDSFMPVVFIAPRNDRVYDKIVSNMEEVKARKGNMIVITNEDNDDLNRLSEIVLKVPKCSEYIFPILAAIPLQLLSYYIAKYRDCSIDQPRNLAKAVTVE